MKYFLGPVNILTQRTTQPGLNPEQQKGNSHASHYRNYIFRSFLGDFVVNFWFFLVRYSVRVFWLFQVDIIDMKLLSLIYFSFLNIYCNSFYRNSGNETQDNYS